MGVTPAQLLELAKSLIDDRDEARNRAAASRSYYAAFHVCKPLAESMPKPPGKFRGTHQEIIRKFKQYVNSKSELMLQIRVIGYMLHQAHQRRIIADYHNRPPRPGSAVLDSAQNNVIAGLEPRLAGCHAARIARYARPAGFGSFSRLARCNGGSGFGGRRKVRSRERERSTDAAMGERA